MCGHQHLSLPTGVDRIVTDILFQTGGIPSHAEGREHGQILTLALVSSIAEREVAYFASTSGASDDDDYEDEKARRINSLVGRGVGET